MEVLYLKSQGLSQNESSNLSKVSTETVRNYIKEFNMGYLWSLKRIFIKSPSGRQRFNVLGAMNAVTKKLVEVSNTSYITSIQICDLLVKIASRQRPAVPITIVLDNARYQRCKLVMTKAAELSIELLFCHPMRLI